MAEGHGRTTAADFVVALIAGLLAGLLFVALFPGRALSTLMHNVLKLPGPGAGTGMLVGPYLVMISLIIFTHRRKVLVPFVTFASAGLSHTVASIYLSPGVLTEPTLQAAISSVVLSGVFLELSLDIARKLPDRWAFMLAAIATDLAFVGFQWAFVFPIIGKSVLPADAALLAGLSSLMAVLLGVLPALLYARVFAGSGKD
jgi:hypothetical protein